MARPRICPSSNAARASSICSRECRLVTSFPGGNLSARTHSKKSGKSASGAVAPTIVALVQKHFVQVDRDIGARNPEEHGRTTLVVRPWLSLPDCLQNLESSRRRADGVKGIVNSAGADRPNRTNSVGIRGIATMGSTEFPGKLQLAVVQVYRDNGISASNGSGANRRRRTRPVGLRSSVTRTPVSGW